MTFKYRNRENAIDLILLGFLIIVNVIVSWWLGYTNKLNLVLLIYNFISTINYIRDRKNDSNKLKYTYKIDADRLYCYKGNVVYAKELTYIKYLKLIEVTVVGKITFKRLEYALVFKNGVELMLDERYKNDSGRTMISILQSEYSIPTIKAKRTSWLKLR